MRDKGQFWWAGHGIVGLSWRGGRCVGADRRMEPTDRMDWFGFGRHRRRWSGGLWFRIGTWGQTVVMDGIWHFPVIARFDWLDIPDSSRAMMMMHLPVGKAVHSFHFIIFHSPFQDYTETGLGSSQQQTALFHCLKVGWSGRLLKPALCKSRRWTL